MCVPLHQLFSALDFAVNFVGHTLNVSRTLCRQQAQWKLCRSSRAWQMKACWVRRRWGVVLASRLVN